MTNPEAPKIHIPTEGLQRIDELCIRFEEALNSANPDSIESMLQPLPEDIVLRARAIEELLPLEWDDGLRRGHPIRVEDYLNRFSEHALIVQQAYDAWIANQAGASLNHPESTMAFAANSQVEELAKWIEQYRESRAADPSLRPSEWLAQIRNAPDSVRTAMRGMEFLSELNKNDGTASNRIGEFRILREIGRGGMGVVFEAEQESLGRIVALKVLWFGAVSDPEAIRRFQREASTVAKLHHTNIVPIFSVGTEGPINYYAMQLIEGQSLDRVAKERGGPIDWTTVAEWGLQAAEALVHAHYRGVIHRDVKPSNLLLDPDDRIWLTDFGLAKRSDDVTLSIAGALLGTPRYMSPEQASASTRNVDHRSDIYSLGATLYELATGKPVFQSSTPHGVISQILTAQPTPANQVAREIPRDFNTILMKCLAKSADERYDSAKELANDLRAVLEGRPIQAKRPNFFEQSQQWIRRHRREFGWSVKSIAGTACLVMAIGLSWFAWTRLREVRLSLTSPSAPIVAELLHIDGSQALRQQTVPTQDPLSVSPGNYTMRVSAPGLLSQDYDIELLASERRKQSLNPEDQLLMPSLTDRFETTVVRSKQGAAIVAYDETDLTIEIRSGPARGINIIPMSSFAAYDSCKRFAWPPSKIVGGILDNADKFDVRPWLYPDMQDWNGDGIEDILIATRHQALVALVSRDGNIVWSVGLAPDVTQAPPVNSQEWSIYRCPRSTIAEMPIAIEDIDSDGAPDMIVQVASINPDGNPDLSKAERHVLALSGSSGTVLWDYSVPKELFESQDGREVDYHFRWFTGTNSSSSGGGGGFIINQGQWSRVSTVTSLRTSEYVPFGTVLVPSKQANSHVLYQAGSSLIHLEQTSGKPGLPSASMDLYPFQPPTIVELDGKPGEELVFMEDLHGVTDASQNPPLQYNYRMRVVAWSLKEDRMLWSHMVDAHSPFTRNWLMEQPKWPVSADLDGDGRAEVIVPDDSELLTRGSAGRSSLVVLSGDQGKVLWKQAIRHADTQIERIVVGPDINGDKHRDIYVASMSGLPVRVHVDCLSGVDGSRLWTSFAPIENNESPESFYLDEAFLWNNSEDGWPQLVVRTISTQNMQSGTEAYFFSTGSGHVLHRLTQANRFSIGDIDADGADDLAITKYANPTMGMAGKCSTHFVRGSSGDAWQRLGPPMQAVNDLDGDGLKDLIAVNSQTITAASSSTGQKIWQSVLTGIWPDLQIHSSVNREDHGPAGNVWDFDRDGVDDLIIEKNSSGYFDAPLEAISGRTGTTLWISAIKRHYQQGLGRIICTDLDGDGVSEILYYTFNDSIVDTKPFRSSYSGQDGHLMLIALSANNGSLRWRMPLSREYGSVSNTNMPYNFRSQNYPEISIVDVNSDGCRDAIVVAESSSIKAGVYSTDLVALDGHTGAEIWRIAAGSNDNASHLFSSSARVAIPQSEHASPLSACVILNCEDVAGPNGEKTRVARLAWHDTFQQKEIWQQTIAIDSQFSRGSQIRAESLRPYLLRRSTSKSWIALGIRREHQAVIVLIDHQGNIVGKKELNERQFASNDVFDLLVADCDGDGNDEIVVANGGLEVFKIGGSIERMYHLPMIIDEWGATKVVFLPAAGNRSSQLVTIDEANARAVGYEAQTGRRLWECTGPARHHSYTSDNKPIQLMEGDGLEMPWVVFNHIDQINCRIPSWIDSESNSNGKSREKLISALRWRAVLPGDDPRMLRKLPWYESIDAARTAVEFPLMITNGLLCSLVLVVIPGWYVDRTIRTRVFNLRWWLLFPVIVAAWLLVFMSNFSELPVPKLQKIGFAVYLAPAILLGVHLLIAIFRKQWKALGWMVTGILAASFVLAVASFIENVYPKPLEHGERFSFDGWYWILLYGYFVFGWLRFLIGVSILPIKAIWRRIRSPAT